MRKFNSGISMIVLITMVAVIVIISTTVTITGANVSNKFKKEKFALEVSYIQEAIGNYRKANNNQYPLKNNSFTIDITNTTVPEQFALETKDVNNKITLYEVDLSKLGNIETIYGLKKTTADTYAMSLQTGIVYYIDGIHVANNVYYTLDDELKKMINYTGIQGNVTNKDGIIFLSSNLNWCKGTDTTIYIPDSYVINSIKVNNNDLTTSTLENGYKKYNTGNLTYNYTIYVDYTKGDISNKQTYSISNIDVVSPVLNVSEINTLKETQSSKSIKYVTVNSSDDLSGIKYIKYEYENILEEDAPSYFTSNGILLQEDIIEIKENASHLTVYVEDNAGNYTIVNISI